MLKDIVKAAVDKYYNECKECIWFDYTEDGKRICPERIKKCANFIDIKISKKIGEESANENKD